LDEGPLSVRNVFIAGGHPTTIPGVSDIVAQVIVSEVGYDMSRFASAGHLRSWAGLWLRNDESAGKRRSTRTRPGAPWLKTTLVQGRGVPPA
jgi:transposase